MPLALLAQVDWPNRSVPLICERIQHPEFMAQEAGRGPVAVQISLKSAFPRKLLILPRFKDHASQLTGPREKIMLIFFWTSDLDALKKKEVRKL